MLALQQRVSAMTSIVEKSMAYQKQKDAPVSIC